VNNRAQSVTYNIDREENDYYATDPRVIDDLLEREDFNNIWEPAAGKGHLTYRLQKLGKQVYSSDLIDRGQGFDIIDFLKTDKKWDGDIITNPPYKIAQPFIQKALDIVQPGRKVAMFVRLLFLESKKRKIFFQDNPIKYIYVYSSRVECKKGADLDYVFDGGSVTCYAWFIWEKGYKGETIIRWI
jgi:hypothetical protein